MEIENMEIGQKHCFVYTSEHPVALLIQPMGRHEQGAMNQEAALIAAGGRSFVMAAFDVADWDRELTPWPDPAVSRDQGVGEHAVDTLAYIEHSLLPYLRQLFGPLPCILGGYSLGGLFSLWASTKVDSYAGVAASSPSVWIKDWLTYAEHHPTFSRNVYLSLGDKEELVKNKSIAQVGSNIRAYHDMLTEQLGADHTLLKWNAGNHFQDGVARTADGFVWCLSQLTLSHERLHG